MKEEIGSLQERNRQQQDNMTRQNGNITILHDELTRLREPTNCRVCGEGGGYRVLHHLRTIHVRRRTAFYTCTKFKLNRGIFIQINTLDIRINK